ncbi:hypothetical protein NDU88_003691 [Pleurodeles waltl]|uniref:Uncharacterized protein n=1 Tax=Pleurodeles waltl TaxID=8319 RepID=A0AAV7W7P1_PLEWA|nr:hypothetical protein NDU88_003691 [Pleurodeles waltl]
MPITPQVRLPRFDGLAVPVSSDSVADSPRAGSDTMRITNMCTINLLGKGSSCRRVTYLGPRLPNGKGSSCRRVTYPGPLLPNGETWTRVGYPPAGGTFTKEVYT